jgi:hypothetical protein
MKVIKSILKMTWLGIDSGAIISISILSVAILLLTVQQKVWMLLVVSVFLFFLARFIRNHLTFSIYSSDTKQYGLIGSIINFLLSVFFVQSFAGRLENIGTDLLLPVDYKYKVQYPEELELYLVVSVVIITIIISLGVAFAIKTLGFSILISALLVFLYFDKSDISKLPFSNYVTIENITITLAIYSFLVLYGLLKSPFMSKINV